VDHKEQHHQHHREEREHKKQEEHRHELAAEKQPQVIHPIWFAVIGFVLVLAAVLIWTFVFGGYGWLV
jgi:hypothetical protein